MPRRKKDQPQKLKLAPCVYWKHGAWRLVKKGRWTTLGKTEAEAYRKLAEIADALKGPANTINALLSRYERDILPDNTVYSPRTQELYSKAIARLRPVFGHMAPQDLETADGYDYLTLRGKISKYQANQEIAVLSIVLNYAIRWGVLKTNPLHRIQKLKTPRRTRHVTDAEFQAVLDCAPPIIHAAMRIAASTGLRLGDLLALRQDQIRDDGIHITPAKTATTSGKSIVIRWSTYLLQACQDVLYAPRDVESDTWLIADKAGRQYHIGTFSHHFHAAVIAAVKEKTLAEPFRFHDLRAMAASKAKDATKLLGHSSPATTKQHYMRAPEIVDPAI